MQPTAAKDMTNKLTVQLCGHFCMKLLLRPSPLNIPLTEEETLKVHKSFAVIHLYLSDCLEKTKQNKNPHIID